MDKREDMIRFRTEVDIPDFKNKMGYRHPSMVIGSCFAENIGNYLKALCFPIVVNPSGILYNPISIANNLNDLLTGKKFTHEDLFFANGLFNSFSHHSRFSCSDPERTLDQMNVSSSEASEVLNSCHHLFITFGTAWVFSHKTKGLVVSNCHKCPSSMFDRYRLSVKQIIDKWIPLIEQLKANNPDLQIIFTVSPIRHMKDGAHENQLSKSILLLAIEEMVLHFGIGVVSYFPSYEIVLDELRDYRFYAPDMTHPSEVAVEFIREKFISAFLDPESKTISAELEKILPALKHKMLNENTDGYLSFINAQMDKIKQLQIKYPFVDLKTITMRFNEKIAY
jgi:hypothetical protein